LTGQNRLAGRRACLFIDGKVIPKIGDSEFPPHISTMSPDMRRGSPSIASLPIWLGLLVAFHATFVSAQEKQDDKHRSPQATVRTLLTAITVARAHPQVIQEAAACLDVGGLPASQRHTAGLLASQLEAVLRAKNVDSSQVPDESDGDSYVLPGTSGQPIALRRMPDGRWLFDRETVAQIPKLYTEAQQQLMDKNKAAASLNVPPAYASARATVQTLLTGFRRQDYDRLLSCLDLSEIPMVAQREVGAQAVNKLKQIIVRQKRIILQDIPDSNFSDPYIWVAQPEGVVELVRISAGERKGEWLFSRETIRSLDKLYVAYEEKPYSEEIVALGVTIHRPNPWTETEMWLRSQLPGWLRATVFSTAEMNLEIYELLGYLLIPALAFCLHRLITWLLAALMHWILAWRGWAMPRDVLVKRLRPTGRLAGVVFLRWGLLALEPDRVVLVPLLVVLNPLIWVLAMWALFRLLDVINDLLEIHLIAQNRRPEIAQMLWPVVSLVAKIVIFVFTVFRLMTIFSWDMSAVLTGLGIGGLAVALGAQDSLKNLFGSFTLIADRPFVVGESVKIGDRDVGVVQSVGLRSTRIRTADGAMLIVPNSNLTTTNIVNFGQPRYRRFQARIGVANTTSPEKLTTFRDGIRQVIMRQERVRKEQFEAAINDLSAKAIEISISVEFDVADRDQELAARDALILDILRLADEMKIERS